MREQLKIETDLLQGLVEENKELLRKAFALVRTLELNDREFETKWEAIVRPWPYRRLAHSGVSLA